MSDYEVAELTWKNGHLSMHGHGGAPPRIAGKSSPPRAAAAWDKPPPRGSGTLEAVVVPWLSPPNHPDQFLGASAATGATATAAVDAVVPCPDLHPHGCGAAWADRSCGTCVASCSERKRAWPHVGDRNCSATGSAASMGLTFDTCEIGGGGDEAGFTASVSPEDASPEMENTSSAADHDSVSHTRRSQNWKMINRRGGCDDDDEEKKKTGKYEKRRSSSTSTKRSRAAAVHNQSERKRRDRINDRMTTLQKLVPNSNKTDKASILDEVIEYLKQLQAQVEMMSRMSSIPHMMMPMTTMQQMQMIVMMAQMAQMGMGMGMGMGMMDMSSLGRPGRSGISEFLPSAMGDPWADGQTRDWLSTTGGTVLPDPFAAFMACQPQQPMTMDAYSRMAALYQQLYQQPPGSNPKI